MVIHRSARWRRLLPALAVALAASSGAAAEVVARVGPLEITRADLHAAVQTALSSQYYHRTLVAEKKTALEREQLQVLIRWKLDALGGIDRGMTLPLGEAEKRRKEVERRAGRDGYRRLLETWELSRAGHRRALAEKMLGEEAYQKYVKAAAAVTDAEVRQSYDSNPARWREPEAAHVLHLLLKVEAAAMAGEWQRVESEARAVMARLAEGEAFESVAAERSEDRYRIKGGDLGWVHRGRLIEPVESEVWAAQVGALVGPLRSTEGFHVVKVLARRAERQMTFDEAAPMIRTLLESERLAAAESRWYDQARVAHPVVVLDPRLLAEAR